MAKAGAELGRSGTAEHHHDRSKDQDEADRQERHAAEPDGGCLTLRPGPPRESPWEVQDQHCQADPNERQEHLEPQRKFVATVAIDHDDRRPDMGGERSRDDEQGREQDEDLQVRQSLDHADRMKPHRAAIDTAVAQPAAPRVRRLRADEWAAYRSIRLLALLDAPDAFGSTYQRELAFGDEEWQARISPPDGAVFVADGPDDLVGLAIGAPAPSNAGAAALFAMWVAPAARRLGVGRALIAAVKAWAIDAGYPRLGLGVTTTNAPAIALYERAGFVATGDRFPLRAGSDLTIQIMTIPLSTTSILDEPPATDAEAEDPGDKPKRDPGLPRR
jgi:GNAT superfamily N-acetyltransferase